MGFADKCTSCSGLLTLTKKGFPGACSSPHPQDGFPITAITPFQTVITLCFTLDGMAPRAEH